MNERKYDPITGQPIDDNTTPQRNFDPMTGQPLNNNTTPQRNFNPYTGQPLNNIPKSPQTFQAMPTNYQNPNTAPGQATKKGISPTKVLILCAAVFGVLMVLLIINISPAKPNKPEDDMPATPTPSATATTEEEAEEIAEETNEGIDSVFEFSVNGRHYTLPLDINEFTNGKWSYEFPQDADKIVPGNESEMITLTYNGEVFYFNVINHSVNSQPVSKCMVYSVSFFNSDAKNANIDIKLYNDKFSFDKTTPDDLKAILGEPLATKTKDDNLYLEYGDEEHRYSASTSYCFTNNLLSYVDITNRLMPEDFQQPEVHVETPDLVYEYEAPETLGDDMLSGNFSLDGKVYNLPAPLTAFTDNGWTYNQEMYLVVPAMTHDYMSLQKDDISISLRVYNPLPNATTFDHAIVTSVTSPSEPSNLEFVLPGGIKPGSTINDLENSVLHKYKYIQDTEEPIYATYKIPFDANTSSNYPKEAIEIYIDEETNTVYAIGIDKGEK